MTERLQSLLKGCAEIFFLPGAVNGTLLLAITMINPRIGLAGMISVLAAYALSRLVGMDKTFLLASYYIYNPFLVGCSLGFRFEIGPLLILLAVMAGMVTFVVTLLLGHLLVTRLRLPILSLPFSVTSAIIYLVVARYAHGLQAATTGGLLQEADFGLPLEVAGFFRSFGAILFSPSVLVGALVAALVLGSSRALFLLAVGGYYAGVLTRGMFGGSMEEAFLKPDNFNFLLISMALGGMFLVPSLTSCVLALFAAAITPLVLDVFAVVWSPLGIPAFTVPFCLVIVTAVFTLRLAGFPGLLIGVGKTPEEIRENAIVARLRYPGDLRSLFLPFSGKWTVWQGFNGRWTHQGFWRHAYDFVIQGEDGRTHRGEGNQLADYYCYRMPVLAPVRGRVVRVVDHLADNPIGSVSGGSNWGNLVIVQDLRGFYVEISHFSPKSIRVKEGDWLERGAVLGLCGNSGHSPQPHIHIQVQATEAVGAATLPFSFASYQHGTTFHSNDLPDENSQIEPVYPEKQYEELTSFVLDDELSYDVFRRGRPVDHLKLKVKLAADGTNYFETEHGRLYFGKCDGTFYFYRVDGDDPYLKLLFLASPRLPLMYRKGMRWVDYVPASVVVSGARRFVARLGAILFSDLARVQVVQTYVGHNRIESVATSPLLGKSHTAQVELDAKCGIAAVKCGELELRRAIAPDGGLLVPAAPQCARQRFHPALAASVLCLVSLVGLVGADRNSADEQVIRAAIQKSVESEKAKNYAEGIETLLKDYSAHSANYPVNVRLGWLSYLSGDYPSAEKYYQAATRAAPKSVEAAHGLTLSFLAQAKYAETEAAARKVLSLDSGNYYGKLRLEFALRMQQKNKEAADVLQALLTAYPADASLDKELAALKTTLDPAAMAIKVEAFEAKTEAAWQASLQAETGGNYAEAIKALADALKAHPKSYQLNVRMGWLSYASSDHKNSETYYDQAIKSSPSAIEAKLGRLSPLLAQAKYAEAEAQAAQIVRADSLNYWGNFWHSYALRWQNKAKNAEPIIDRLAAAYPADSTVLLELGLVRALQPQRKAESRDVFQQVLMFDPGNTVATQQLKEP